MDKVVLKNIWGEEGRLGEGKETLENYEGEGMIRSAGGKYG